MTNKASYGLLRALGYYSPIKAECTKIFPERRYSYGSYLTWMGRWEMGTGKRPIPMQLTTAEERRKARDFRRKQRESARKKRS